MMDGDKPGDEIVTSNDNKWLVRKSTSHPGLNYYFNPETGESVWSLSEADIEKAKKYTRNLTSKSAVNLGGCSEPRDPPAELSGHSCNRNDQLVNRYNQQMINNKKPFPIAAFVLPQNTAVIAPSYNEETFNRQVWAIRPTNQIVIAPTMSTFISPPGTSSNIQFNEMERNAASQIEERAGPSRFVRRDNRFSQKSHTNNSAYRKRFQGRFQEFKKQFKNTDLREILSLKRNQEAKNKDLHEFKNTNDEQQTNDLSNQQLNDTNYNPKREDNEKEEAYNSDVDNADTDWLEDNVLGTNFLDVTCLKQLANPQADPDRWYIVPDKVVLLRHFLFLTILFKSDDQCHLMVPREVMAELRAAKKAGGHPRVANRARRALAFISQQLDADRATIGNDLCENTDFEDSHILKCCLNLVEQYYHVVLLSNDIELQQFKNKSLPIFTIQQLKEFLSRHTTQEDELEPVSPEPEPPIKTPMKITIPNDLLSPPKETVVSSKSIDIQTDDDLLIHENEINTKSQSLPNSSKSVSTMNAEVQTDLGITDLAKPHMNSATDDRTTKVLILSKEKVGDNEKGHDAKQTNSKIRLRRDISKQMLGESSGEPKQFKWRKRRKTFTSQSYEPMVSSGVNCDQRDHKIAATATEQINSDNRVSGTQTVHTVGNVATEEIDKHNELVESINKEADASFDNIMEGSEASSCILQRSILERIVVDETSTSVVSNTTSNMDSEIGAVNQNNFKTTVRPCAVVERKHIMLVILDKAMEECLRTRCDEWISRFVQIMEEVLTQVLQQDSQNLSNLLPPPWNVYEATECIIEKFKNINDVSYAAKKLLGVLTNITDRRGGITKDLAPSDYMEMYGYGVYLINTLKVALSNCEDLQTAAESLSKLLHDIKNPNSSHNDTFCDTTIQSVAVDDSHISSLQNVVMTDKEKPASQKKETEVRHTDPVQHSPKTTEVRHTDSVQHSPKTAEPYNLRSRKSKMDQDGRQEDLDAFFNSLCLQKNSPNVNYLADESSRSTDTSRFAIGNAIYKKQLSPIFKTPSENPNEDKEKRDESQKSNENSQPEIVTRIVRNFTKCPQFEQKLKDRVDQDLEMLDDSEYHKDDYENMNVDYCLENDEEMNLNPDDKETQSEKVNNESIESPNETDKYFKLVVTTMMIEIKEAFLQIHALCVSSNEELRKNGISSIKKIEILNKAEKALLNLGNTIKALNRLYLRETKEPRNSPQSTLLRNAGSKDFDFNDKQTTAYGHIISKLITQANILQDALKIVIEAATC